MRQLLMCGNKTNFAQQLPIGVKNKERAKK